MPRGTETTTATSTPLRRSARIASADSDSPAPAPIATGRQLRSRRSSTSDASSQSSSTATGIVTRSRRLSATEDGKDDKATKQSVKGTTPTKKTAPVTPSRRSKRLNSSSPAKSETEDEKPVKGKGRLGSLPEEMEVIKESEEEEKNVAEKQDNVRKEKILSLRKRLVEGDDDDLVLLDSDVEEVKDEKEKEVDKTQPSQETVKSAEDVEIPSSQDLFSDTDSTSQKTEVEKENKKILDKFNRTPENSKVIIKDVKVMLAKTPENEMKRQSISEKKDDESTEKKTEIKEAIEFSKSITFKEEEISSGDESFSLQLNMSVFNTTQNKQNESFGSESSEKENQNLNVSKKVETPKKVADDYCEPMEVDETIIDDEKKDGADKETGEKMSVLGEEVSEIAKDSESHSVEASGKKPQEGSAVEKESEKKGEEESLVSEKKHEEKRLSTEEGEQKEKTVEEASVDIIDDENLEEKNPATPPKKASNTPKQKSRNSVNGEEVTNEDHVEGTPKKVSDTPRKEFVDLTTEEENSETPKQKKRNSLNDEKSVTKDALSTSGQKKRTSLGSAEEPKENIDKNSIELNASKHEEEQSEESTRESQKRGQKSKTNDESDDELSDDNVEEEAAGKSPRKSSDTPKFKKRNSLNVTNEEEGLTKEERVEESPKKAALSTSVEKKRASRGAAEEPKVDKSPKTQLNSSKQKEEEHVEESKTIQLESQEPKTKDKELSEDSIEEENVAERNLNSSIQKKRSSLQATEKKVPVKESPTIAKDKKHVNLTKSNDETTAKSEKPSSQPKELGAKRQSSRLVKLQLDRLRAKASDGFFSDSEDENLVLHLEGELAKAEKVEKEGCDTPSNSPNVTNVDEDLIKKERVEESPKKAALSTSVEKKRASRGAAEEPKVDKTELNSSKQKEEEHVEESKKLVDKRQSSRLLKVQLDRLRAKASDGFFSDSEDENLVLHLEEELAKAEKAEKGGGDTPSNSPNVTNVDEDLIKKERVEESPKKTTLSTSVEKKRASQSGEEEPKVDQSLEKFTKAQLSSFNQEKERVDEEEHVEESKQLGVKRQSSRLVKIELSRLTGETPVEQEEDDTSSDSSSSSDSHEIVLLEAVEAEEDTPSEGSNDIVDLGEPINTTSSESSSSSDEYETGSFITDDETQEDLLSGGEFDIYDDFKKKVKSPKKRSSRIVLPSKPLLKMKESPRKSRIICPSESSDEDIEKKDTFLLKEKSLTSAGNKTQEIDKSASEGEVKKTVSILEDVSVEDIGSEQLITHISEAVEKFFADVKEDSGAVKINLSLDYSTTSCKDLDETVNVSDVDKKKKKKRKYAGVTTIEQIETDVETKLKHEIAELEAQIALEEIAQQHASMKKKKKNTQMTEKEDQVVLEEVATKKKKKDRKLAQQDSQVEEENHADNTFVISKSDKRKHKKLERSQSEEDNNKINKPKVKQQALTKEPEKRKQEIETEIIIPKKKSKPSEAGPSNKPSKSMKAETSVLKVKPRTDPVKTFKPSTSNAVEDMKVDYFPNPQLSHLIEAEKKRKPKKPSLSPGPASANYTWNVKPIASVRSPTAKASWEIEAVVDPKPSKTSRITAESSKKKKKTKKGIPTARELIKSRDFKTQELYESGRIKRMDTKELMRKKLLK